MDALRSIRLGSVRCLDCGLTRWALFSSLEQALEQTCDLCGGPLAPERRRPGAGPRSLPLERRDGVSSGTPLAG